MKVCLLLFLVNCLVLPEILMANENLRIGSKRFTESYILAEILAQVAEEVGEAKVERRFGLGGTGITFQALEENEVDVYPEYSGTLKQAIVKGPNISAYLSKREIETSPRLGFNNSYGISITQETKENLNLKSIEDLKDHENVKLGLSHEFIERNDGLKALEEHYNLSFSDVVPMEHGLSYNALKEGNIQANVVYTTDAKIAKYDLFVLDDNRDFFPDYEAILLQRSGLKQKFPRTWEAWNLKVFGKLSEIKMRELNAMAEERGLSFSQVASSFLYEKDYAHAGREISWRKLAHLSMQHLKLVGISLLFSVFLGLPLGILATKRKWLAQMSLVGSGLLQTIPSLALLCFLIPFVGIGEKPAYIALFLYGLLPIVRNTFTGLSQINIKILESSRMMGMNYWQQLLYVRMPLASPSIMAGIKTSAVINVGTATLAAFIGAGGLGSFIVTGLALNDNHIILQGAIPAAGLAIFIHIIFEVLDRLIVPSPLKK